MKEKEYSISLRVWHPTMLGDDIVSRIKKPATVVHNVGQPMLTPKGNPIGRISEESFCSIRLLDHGKGSFVDGIELLLPELQTMADTLVEVVETGGVAELYVWVFPEEDNNLGFVLSRNVLDSFDRLRLQLSVEILLLEPDD